MLTGRTVASIRTNAKKYQELQDVLTKEQLKSEQHRLNFEKLKTFVIRLQLQRSQTMNQKVDVLETVKEPTAPLNKSEILPNSVQEIKLEEGVDAPGPSSLKKGATQKSSEHLNVIKEDGTKFAKPIVNKKEESQELFQPGREKLNEGEDGRKLVELLKETQHWKKLYIRVLDEHQRFKAQADFVLESNIKTAEEKVSVLVEEMETTRQTLEKEKFSLTSTCRNLNREKIALECEIRTLGDELEETRRKLLRLEEKVTKECDFHHLHKIDESNFHASEMANCRNESHRGLRSALAASERKNKYLEQEVEDVNTRNDQLTEEIKEIYSAHDEQVKELKNAMNVYETQLEEQRAQFEIKVAETESMVEAQENYLKEIDSYLKEKEENGTLNTEHLSNYAAGLLNESNKALLILEQRLEKNQVQTKDLTSSLLKAVEVIKKLEVQTKHCYDDVLRSCTEIYTALSIPCSPKRGNNFSKPFELEPTIGLLESKFQSSKLDDGTDPEAVLKMTNKLLNELTHNLKFWKKENDAQFEQLKIRTRDLENNLSTGKLKLLSELKSTREKYLKYRRWVKNVRGKLTKSQLNRNVRRRSCSRGYVVGTPKSRQKFVVFRKETPRKRRSSAMCVIHPNELAQLQRKHVEFRKILEHVDKYISPEPDYWKVRGLIV